MATYVGYIRQSKESEGGLSPDTQRAEIEHWSATPGSERVIKWLAPDLDWSGKSLERPSMREALRLVRAGQADGIVVSKLDRLTRSVADLNALIKEAQSSCWNLVALDLGIDLKSKNGKMTAQLLGVLSEWYLDGVTEEWAKVRRHKIERGEHWGAPPLGYARARSVNSRGQDCPGGLVVNGWADEVRRVFALKAGGASWLELARYLTETGAPTVRERAAAAREGREERGSVWEPTSVKAIIANRAYLGEARAGSLVKADAHPPLVDERTWRQANRKGKLHEGERKGGPMLGRGLCRCATCGSGLVKSNDAKGHWFYRCRGAGCEQKVTISVKVVEPYVVEAALAYVGAFAGEHVVGDHSAERAEIAAELAEIEAELKATDVDEQSGELSAREAGKVRTKLEARRDELEGRLDGLEDGDTQRAKWYVPAAGQIGGPESTHAGVTTAVLFAELPVADQRTVLRSVIDRITVKPGRAPVPERVEIQFVDGSTVGGLVDYEAILANYETYTAGEVPAS
jgi:site-specific DNA recombinase